MQSDRRRVIAYASTTFNKAQTNYSTIEQELAAIRWAVGVFRSFIYGIPFVLYTDHRPLVYMSNMSQQNARMMRTMNELNEYDFQIRYRPGKDNFVADTLSRLNPPDLTFPETEITNVGLPEGLSTLMLVSGGGDSLVHGLWIVLNHYRGQYNPSLVVPVSHVELRLQLASELLSRPDWYGLTQERTTRSKLKLSKLPGQMPPIEFVSAFCSLYQMQVWIHHGLKQPVIHTIPGQVATSDPAQRVHLQCFSGVHYNPVTENKLYLSPQVVCSVESPADLVQACLEETSEDEAELDIAFANEQISCMCACSHSSASVSTVVQIGDVTCCALIDTGAQISLISDQVWEQLQPQEQVDAQHRLDIVRIRSLGTEGIHTEGVVNIKWKLSGHDIDGPMPFARVKIGSMPFCVILGANIIQKLNLVINFASGQFSFDSSTERITRPLRLFSVNVVQYEDLCLVQEELEFVSCSGTDSDCSGLPSSILTPKQIVQVQQSHFATKTLFHKVRSKSHTSTWKQKCLRVFVRYASSLDIRQGVIVYTTDTRCAAVIPFPFLTEVVVRTHYQMSHVGRNKLVKLLQASFWHPSLLEVVTDVCNSCLVCQKFKVSSQLATPPVHRIKMQRPFQMVAADLVQLPRTRQGHVGCLVVVDHYSKWASVVPLKNKKAQTVASALEHRIIPALPRKPEKMLTDNGPEFVADLFNKVLDQYDIRHVFSSPYKPASNGAVERLNRTVIETLRCITADLERWDDYLTKAVVTYNNSWHSAINMTPSESLMNKDHTLSYMPILDVSTRAHWKEGHPSFAPFKEGDLVLKKVQMHGNLTSNKFLPRFDGPYRIVQVMTNNVSYRMIIDGGDARVFRAHHTQLKKLNLPPHYLRVHSSYQEEAETDQLPIPSDEESCDLQALVGGSYTTSEESSTDDSSVGSLSTDFSPSENESVVPELPSILVPVGKSVKNGGFRNMETICYGNLSRGVTFIIDTLKDKSVDDNISHTSESGLPVLHSTRITPQEGVLNDISLSSIMDSRTGSSILHDHCDIPDLLVSERDELIDREDILETIQSMLSVHESVLVQTQEEMDQLVEESRGTESSLGLRELLVTYETEGNGHASSMKSKRSNELSLRSVPVVLQELNSDDVCTDVKMVVEPSHQLPGNMERIKSDGMEQGELSDFTVSAVPVSIHAEEVIASRRRISLSPLKDSLRECRNIIDEYRKRSRSRVISRYRDSPVSVSPKISSAGGQTRYHTRSRGPVIHENNI